VAHVPSSSAYSYFFFLLELDCWLFFTVALKLKFRYRFLISVDPDLPFARPYSVILFRFRPTTFPSPSLDLLGESYTPLAFPRLTPNLFSENNRDRDPSQLGVPSLPPRGKAPAAFLFSSPLSRSYSVFQPSGPRFSDNRAITRILSPPGTRSPFSSEQF